MTAPLLPVEPLLKLIPLWHQPRNTWERPASVAFAARVLGVDRKQIYNARARGVAAWRADEWAIRAGFHPSEVWGDEWLTTA